MKVGKNRDQHKGKKIISKHSKIRASFTIEAAIAMGFILCFLNMSISYEIQQVHRILEKITLQRKEQETWSLEDEIKNYIIFKELLDKKDVFENEENEEN